MKNKSSEGLSISTIVIAALALTVLIVLMIIFTKNISTTNENLGGCTAKGGQCAKSFKDGCSEPYPIPLIISGSECKSANNLCCLKVK